MGDPTNWLHALAYWDHADGLTLIVDDLAFRSHGRMKTARSGDKFYDSDSVLRLGDPKATQSRKYAIAVNSLTIWERKLSENEVETVFTKGMWICRCGCKC
jgi:hypothetical protein